MRELWAHRELLYFLIWGDLKLRYKQTVLGAAWAVIQPIITMVVFSVFLGKLAGVPSNGIPYPVFTFSALAPWTYFSNAFGQASLSLVRYERVIKKVYFPRLVVPSAAVLSGLVDFAVAMAVLLGIMLYYGITPGWAVVTLPFFIVLATLTAFGVSLWFAALNAKFRDVRYTVPFLIQIWLFLTPIAYPSSLVPKAWRPLYSLNPMTGVVEGFRWALVGGASVSGVSLLISTLTVLALLVGGMYYFRRMEQTFADVV